MQFAVGAAYDKSEFGLVIEEDAWKIESEEVLSPDVPEGVTLVHVDLNEFAFGVNTNDIGDGNVAFEAKNVGTQEHELAIVAIPADADVDALVGAVSRVRGRRGPRRDVHRPDRCGAG